MTGIHKTVNKFAPKELRSPGERKLAKENISTHESLDRRMNPEIPTALNEPIMPIPDEEELARSRRRKNARRGGGRASTVLTNEDDRLGP